VNDLPIISDEELHAYIDGALEAERARAVEQALDNNPALAERAASFQADKTMFKTVYGPLKDRPLPPHWLARVQQQQQPQPQSRNRLRFAYAVAAALLVAAVTPLAWRYYAPTMNADVVEAALDARQGMEACPAPTDGSKTGNDLALRQAVASNLHTPDLSRMGYRLCGMHLYGKAAEILYRGPQDQLFTLYVRRSDGSARFDQFERRGLRVCIWQDDQISTVMAGDVSASAMQQLATLSYTGLTS